MAEDSRPTKEIKFSWDLGKRWEVMQITEEPVIITDIVTEPGSKGLVFFVYGVTQNQGIFGFVIPIDFSGLLPRTCKNTGDKDSDYLEWSPHGSKSECIMGEKLVYLRRKHTSECFNPHRLKVVRREKICECTREDWECDIGFFLNGKTNKCQRSDGHTIDTSPPLDCKAYYRVNIGYRKVSGNVCQGGLDLSPRKYTCPGKGIQRYIFTLYEAVWLTLPLFWALQCL